MNQGKQCLLVVALSVARINTEKEAKLNSTTFLLMLKGEICRFVPCVVITGVLKSTPSYAVNTLYQVIYSYMYAVDIIPQFYIEEASMFMKNPDYVRQCLYF